MSTVKVVAIAHYKSKTRPGETHSVLYVQPSGYVRCTCPGFKYRAECRHVNDQIENIARRYAIVPFTKG